MIRRLYLAVPPQLWRTPWIDPPQTLYAGMTPAEQCAAANAVLARGPTDPLYRVTDILVGMLRRCISREHPDPLAAIEVSDRTDKAFGIKLPGSFQFEEREETA